MSKNSQNRNLGASSVEDAEANLSMKMALIKQSGATLPKKPQPQNKKPQKPGLTQDPEKIQRTKNLIKNNLTKPLQTPVQRTGPGIYPPGTRRAADYTPNGQRTGSGIHPPGTRRDAAYTPNGQQTGSGTTYPPETRRDGAYTPKERRFVQPTTSQMSAKEVKKKYEELEIKLVNLQSEQVAIKDRLLALETATSEIVTTNKVIVERTDSIHKMLKELVARGNSKRRTRPGFLPFKSCADLLSFNHAPEEDYNNLVAYLRYIGGHLNPTNAAAKYFKDCFIFKEDLFRNVTWLGSKTNKNIIALEGTRFAKACEDVIQLPTTNVFDIPEENRFKLAMCKALKSAKEAFRRTLKRPFEPAYSDPISPESRFATPKRHKSFEEDNQNLDAGNTKPEDVEADYNENISGRYNQDNGEPTDESEEEPNEVQFDNEDDSGGEGVQNNFRDIELPNNYNNHQMIMHESDLLYDNN